MASITTLLQGLESVQDPTSHAALEAVLLARPEAHEQLAQWSALTDGTWRKLWDKKPNITVASALASRSLTPNQIDFVLKREKRAGVLVGLLLANKLSVAQQTAFVEKSKTASVLNAFVSKKDMEPNLRKLAAEKCGESALVEYLYYNLRDTVSVEEVESFFSAYVSPVSNDVDPFPYKIGNIVRRLARVSPKATSLAYNTGVKTLRFGAVSSPYFTNDTDQEHLVNEFLSVGSKLQEHQRMIYLSFVWNPVASQKSLDSILSSPKNDYISVNVKEAAKLRLSVKPEPVSAYTATLSDFQLEWIKRRFEDPGKRMDRAEDIVALAGNTSLTENTYTYLSKEAYRSGTRAFHECVNNVILSHSPDLVLAELERPWGEAEYYTNTQSHDIPTTFTEKTLAVPVSTLHYGYGFIAGSVMVAVADALQENQPAWELFFTLITDGFDGSIQELVDLVQAV